MPAEPDTAAILISNFASVRLRPPVSLPLLLIILSVRMAAQSPDSASSRLGITGIGALGALVGAASMERDIHATEGGALLDLGWTRTPRLRLQAEVEFLGASYSQFVEVDNRTYSSPISDFSVGLTALYEIGGAASRRMPYVSAGLAVHALSSAFGTAAIDRLYNANPFGSHVGVGVRQWVGSSGRTGIFLELRRVIAENVNRTSLRIGALAFYRDLIRPPSSGRAKSSASGSGLQD